MYFHDHRKQLRIYEWYNGIITRGYERYRSIIHRHNTYANILTRRNSQILPMLELIVTLSTDLGTESGTEDVFSLESLLELALNT